MRIMLDTNILVSMIFFPSSQTRTLAQRLSYHELFLCDYVIDELRIVVDRKFKNKKEALENFFIELPFQLVYTPRNINFSEFPSVRDQKDSPILATALIEDIDIFITGDKDFLVLEIDRPEIMTIKDFLEL